METISAEGLKELLDLDRNLSLLDVREPWEFELCHIQGSINIPMSDIVNNLGMLDRYGETVVICHHGMRSLQVAAYLENSGFEKVINLEGGIAAWASCIDSQMPQY
jgi:rhodanese-related sulfurtransferase